MVDAGRLVAGIEDTKYLSSGDAKACMSYDCGDTFERVSMGVD
jgi:hypothetical protein